VKGGGTEKIKKNGLAFPPFRRSMLVMGIGPSPPWRKDEENLGKNRKSRPTVKPLKKDSSKGRAFQGVEKRDGNSCERVILRRKVADPRRETPVWEVPRTLSKGPHSIGWRLGRARAPMGLRWFLLKS